MRVFDALLLAVTWARQRKQVTRSAVDCGRA